MRMQAWIFLCVFSSALSHAQDSDATLWARFYGNGKPGPSAAPSPSYTAELNRRNPQPSQPDYDLARRESQARLEDAKREYERSLENLRRAQDTAAADFSEMKTRLAQFEKSMQSLSHHLDAVSTVRFDPVPVVAIPRGIERRVQFNRELTQKVLDGTTSPILEREAVHNRVHGEDAAALSRLGADESALIEMNEFAAESASFLDKYSRAVAEGRVQVAADTTKFLRESGYSSVRRSYLSPNGIFNEKVLGEKGGRLASHVSDSLRTKRYSKEGHDVRFQMNRALAVESLAPQSDRQELGAGARAMLLGADQAFAEGDAESGTFLVRNAAEAVDMALGVIPVVGSANDAAQIIYGMVTGYDFSGKRMTAADFALRGSGIVLGLIPGAKLATTGLRIGVSTVGKTFVRGATVIRELNLGPKVASALNHMPGKETRLAKYFASLAGHSTEIATATTARQKEIWRLDFEAMTSNFTKLEVETIQTGKSFNDKLRTIEMEPSWYDSGEVWKATSQKPLEVYRVHSTVRKTLSKYYLIVDPRTMNASELATRYALPDGKEGVVFVSKIEIPAGEQFSMGLAGPNRFGVGGGFQLVIEGTAEKSWIKWTEEFKELRK